MESSWGSDMRYSRLQIELYQGLTASCREESTRIQMGKIQSVAEKRMLKPRTLNRRLATTLFSKQQVWLP
jgi:hypothetical protein